jgi:hypothetical protein
MNEKALFEGEQIILHPVKSIFGGVYPANITSISRVHDNV